VKQLLVGLLGMLILAGILACSPESSRARNGGAGADVGNHSTNLPERSTAPKIGD
jgi:hypothetical protein